MKQYQPLYLKYRPQKLSELVGQEVVTKTLANAIKYNKLVHAYLFCGPRGTGKTSTARILAKSVNCDKGITEDPCNKCVSCVSITQGNSLDVIEIDAASHRKVEDAEDLINRVSLGTYGSRFKIYIIDEVHMLTDHAFNALLKTLEEPPKNVIFILATTEEIKVLPTIVSRCQKLDFKPVGRRYLEEKIGEIAKLEKIIIDGNILELIARRSNGCLRDAVSLLDQISVLQEDNKPINPEEVYTLFGTVDRISLFNLVLAFLTFEKKKTVDLAEDLLKSGKDIGELLKGIIEIVIDLAKAKTNNNFKQVLEQELKTKLSVIDKVDIKHLLKIIERLQDAQSRLRFSFSQELQFIAEVMALLDEDILVSLTDIKERVDRLEGQKSDYRVTSSKQQVTSPELRPLSPELQAEKKGNEEELEPDELEEEHKELHVSDLDATWKKLLSYIHSNPTKTLLTQSGGYLLGIHKDCLEIGLVKDMFLPRLEKDEKKKEMILQAAKLATGKELKKLRFRLEPRSAVSPNSDALIKMPRNKQTTIDNKNLQSDIVEENDEASKAIRDLLGAKKID